MSDAYRFSFGPWNIHEGADPFGPTVRPAIEFAKKFAMALCVRSSFNTVPGTIVCEESEMALFFPSVEFFTTLQERFNSPLLVLQDCL